MSLGLEDTKVANTTREILSKVVLQKQLVDRYLNPKERNWAVFDAGQWFSPIGKLEVSPVKSTYYTIYGKIAVTC